MSTVAVPHKNNMSPTKEQHVLWTDRQSSKDRAWAEYALKEFLLPHLQLQHDGAQFHVQIVSPFELSLIVLSNIQSVPINESTASVQLRKASVSFNDMHGGLLQSTRPREIRAV